MKKNSITNYAEALYQLTRTTDSKQQSAVLKAFVLLLAKQRVLKRAPEIMRAFERLARKHEGITDVVITTAQKLSDATYESIAAQFGEDVEYTEQIDPSLLGGFIVKTENKIFDGSLRTQLSRLQDSLS